MNRYKVIRTIHESFQNNRDDIVVASNLSFGDAKTIKTILQKNRARNETVEVKEDE